MLPFRLQEEPHPSSSSPSNPVDLQVARVQKMLGDEYGTASNIKSRVNRLSVLSAITSAQQRLKLYNKASHLATSHESCRVATKAGAAHTSLQHV